MLKLRNLLKKQKQRLIEREKERTDAIEPYEIIQKRYIQIFNIS
jgi:hypothetical protein